MHESSHFMDEVYFALCKDVNTPISLSLWLRYKYSHKELLDFDLNVGDYCENDTDRFAKDYLCASYLSKYKGLSTGINLEEVALQKFKTSEEQCMQTNLRLKRERVRASDPSVASWIHQARRKIARVLGPASLHCIAPFFGWGPGATHDIPRRRAQVDIKLTTVPITVGGTAKELLQSVIHGDLHWSSSLLGVYPEGPWSLRPEVFQRVDTCRIETVPKSSKTDRVIAVEPTGNLFLQKGVGGYFRERLKRHGIDLDDQTRNQELARKALDLALATLDLRAASDTVSLELVYELLPLDWAFLLDALRSKKALLPNGDVVHLNKFSSMGNGFTFELETLIFWALGQSVLDELSPGGVLSVYGDDIIISRKCAAELIRLLEFVGFGINETKSYVDGLFFESCGKHFFGGKDVTPSYQKETFSKEPEYIRSHNRLVRWCERQCRDPNGFPPIANIRRRAPQRIQHCVSPHGDQADTGFLTDTAEVVRLSSRLDANRGAKVGAVQGKQRALPGHALALLAVNLRKNGTSTRPSDPQGRWKPGEVPLEGTYPVWEDDEDHRSDNVRVEVPITAHAILGWRWVVTPGYCILPRR